MAREDAQDWYERGPTDPESGYITPERAKSAIAQIYQDMASLVRLGDGTNGLLGHLYAPDPLIGDVDADSFVGQTPVGWIDHGVLGAGVLDHGELAGLEHDDHPNSVKYTISATRPLTPRPGEMWIPAP